MSVTNADVAEQLNETREQLGYMGDYLTYAALVGIALNGIYRKFPAAVGGVAGATSRLESGNHGYRLTWTRGSNRLVINHHGHWKSESITEGGKSHHTMSRGKIKPLHDDSWVDVMVGPDKVHDRKCAKRAVKYFQTLLQKSVDTTACIA